MFGDALTWAEHERGIEQKERAERRTGAQNLATKISDGECPDHTILFLSVLLSGHL